MAGTKIINVQKNDSFEDVFEAFRNAEAREVIFIFPKGSPFSKQASYFESIKQEADGSGKTINVMSGDPVIVHLASQYGWGVLQSPTPKPRRTIPAPESYPMADLTAVRKTRVIASDPADSGRRIRDIMTPQKDHPIPVEEIHDSDFSLPIRSSEIPIHAETPQSFTPSPAPAAPPVILRSPMIPQQPQAPQPLQQRPAPMNNDIERLWAEEEQRLGPEARSTSRPGGVPKLNRKISKKLIVFGFVVLLAAIGVFLFFILGSAKIIISPQQQDLNFKLKMTASTAIQEVQPDFNQVPGQVFTAQKEVSGEYPITSEKDVAQKSNGIIKISNKGTASQRLVATTRFESKDGHIFRIPETIMVPAGSSVTARVFADGPGKEYNIGPTTFTVPGFKGTPRFDEFSAISSASMSGGLVGAGKVVSEQTFIKAQEELTAKLRDEITKSIQEQAGDFKILTPVNVVIQTPVTNAKVGDAAETLTMKLKGSANVAAYREADALILIDNYLSKNGNMKLAPRGTDIAYMATAGNKSSKSFPFEATVKGKANAHIDVATIQKAIPGMNESAIRDYFKGIAEVNSARILLSPFWITSVPNDPKKIHITVEE